MLETKILSSLCKVFPKEIKGEEINELSAFSDEPVSFQIAFRTTGSLFRHVYLEIETDIENWEEYLVGFVPVIEAEIEKNDEYFDSKEPGMYPDTLHKRKTKRDIVTISYPWKDLKFEENQTYPLDASRSWQSVWFTIGGKSNPLSKGVYNFTVNFRLADDGRLLAKCPVTIDINGQFLGKQKLIYTAWFHYDCLADIYGEEIFSKRHLEITERFIKAAAETGMNMLLLPAFTPALDTPIGRERRTTQLVGVEKNGDKYVFDFSFFEEFIKMCQKNGIEYFEHSHFFTQWGAEFAPKVMAKVDGEYKRIFGWEIKATSKEYGSFLAQYIEALKPVLKKLNIEDKIYFHTSDEPAMVHLETYKASSAVVHPLLKGYKLFDALSHYDVYEKTDVDVPVVVESSEDIQKFLDNVEDLWIYYTGEQVTDGLSNRLISNTSIRNRLIGVKMYKDKIKGFLNWGYNNYYDIQSQGVMDPRNNPCNFANSPGASFVVYPNCDGTPLITLRMKVFYEGINDYEALMRFEEIKGREKALELIDKHFGEMSLNYCTFDETILLNFRKELNSLLK